MKASDVVKKKGEAGDKKKGMSNKLLDWIGKHRGKNHAEKAEAK